MARSGERGLILGGGETRERKKRIQFFLGRQIGSRMDTCVNYNGLHSVQVVRGERSLAGAEGTRGSVRGHFPGSGNKLAGILG